MPAENDAHPARRPSRGFTRRVRQPLRGIESNSESKNNGNSNSNSNSKNNGNSNSKSNGSGGG
ncbi:hypothetical protein [uncultured Xanthomonas sp.]|uniref:hypothetical protein n=1 Tax=uncultured Xanthomonas sp. TaxID=152831 RepID=UPI0025CBCAD6|nr:hypothetical protein [uncultured Xanthomonas sp.]